MLSAIADILGKPLNQAAPQLPLLKSVVGLASSVRKTSGLKRNRFERDRAELKAYYRSQECPEGACRLTKSAPGPSGVDEIP